jgi:hypothetical protein
MRVVRSLADRWKKAERSKTQQKNGKTNSDREDAFVGRNTGREWPGLEKVYFRLGILLRLIKTRLSIRLTIFRSCKLAAGTNRRTTD